MGIEKSTSKKKFLIFVSLNVLLVCVDYILTYIGTPDLSLEANPLVSVFGLGWRALLINATIFVFLHAVAAYLAFVRFRRSIITCNGFKEYISILYFNRSDKFRQTFYRFPNNKVGWRYTVAFLGTFVTIIYPLFTLLAIVGWIGTISGYYQFYVLYEFLLRPIFWGTTFELFILFITFVVIATFAMYLWYYKEYKINKKELTRVSENTHQQNATS